jgi:hypothetical protein
MKNYIYTRCVTNYMLVNAVNLIIQLFLQVDFSLDY